MSMNTLALILTAWWKMSPKKPAAKRKAETGYFIRNIKVFIATILETGLYFQLVSALGSGTQERKSDRSMHEV